MSSCQSVNEVQLISDANKYVSNFYTHQLKEFEKEYNDEILKSLDNSKLSNVKCEEREQLYKDIIQSNIFKETQFQSENIPKYYLIFKLFGSVDFKDIYKAQKSSFYENQPSFKEDVDFLYKKIQKFYDTNLKLSYILTKILPKEERQLDEQQSGQQNTSGEADQQLFNTTNDFLKSRLNFDFENNYPYTISYKFKVLTNTIKIIIENLIQTQKNISKDKKSSFEPKKKIDIANLLKSINKIQFHIRNFNLNVIHKFLEDENKDLLSGSSFSDIKKTLDEHNKFMKTINKQKEGEGKEGEGEVKEGGGEYDTFSKKWYSRIISFRQREYQQRKEEEKNAQKERTANQSKWFSWRDSSKNTSVKLTEEELVSLDEIKKMKDQSLIESFILDDYLGEYSIFKNLPLIYFQTCYDQYREYIEWENDFIELQFFKPILKKFIEQYPGGEFEYPSNRIKYTGSDHENPHMFNRGNLTKSQEFEKNIIKEPIVFDPFFYRIVGNFIHHNFSPIITDNFYITRTLFWREKNYNFFLKNINKLKEIKNLNYISELNKKIVELKNIPRFPFYPSDIIIMPQKNIDEQVQLAWSSRNKIYEDIRNNVQNRDPVFMGQQDDLENYKYNIDYIDYDLYGSHKKKISTSMKTDLKYVRVKRDKKPSEFTKPETFSRILLILTLRYLERSAIGQDIYTHLKNPSPVIIRKPKSQDSEDEDIGNSKALVVRKEPSNE